VTASVRLALVVVVGGAGAAAAGCDNRQAFHRPDPGWERMMTQEKVVPYAEPMRRPPAGTVVFGDEGRGAAVETGETAGAWVESVPVPMSDDDVRRGRARFETYCAACHGALGDGKSAVAAEMLLRRPPSLHEARIRGLAPGRLFSVVSKGYGLMPSYAAQLDVDDRWRVIAYVQVLQLSQHVDVATLPEADLAAVERSGTP
jgi:mono/diheme cytochrome c family protein